MLPLQLQGALNLAAVGSMQPMGPSMAGSQMSAMMPGGGNPMAGGMGILKGLGGMFGQAQAQPQSLPTVASIPLLERMQTPKLPSTVFKSM